LKPALAGHWEEVLNPYVDEYGQGPWTGDPDYPKFVSEEAKRLDGERTFNGIDYWDGSPHSLQTTRDWAEGDWGVGEYITTFSVMGGPITVGTSGKFTSIFRWIPEENDNPTPLHLKGHFTVEGHVSSGDYWTRDSTKESLELSIANENGTVADHGYGLESILYKDVVVNVPLSSGSINPKTGYFEVEVPWTNVDVQAHSDYNGTNTEITGDVGFHYYYDIDNRAAQISSSAEPSYHKEDDVQKPNVREENGSITVDRAVSYNMTIDPNNQNDVYTSIGSINLAADLFGGSPVNFTNPTYDWTYLGGTDLQSPHPSTTDDELPLVMGLRTAGSSSDYPSTSAVLTVTDGEDERQFTSHYTIRWHDQIEWDKNHYDLIGTNPNHKLYHITPPDPGSLSNPWAAHGSEIQADYTFENFYGEAIEEGAGLVVKTGTEILGGYLAIRTGDPGLALLVNALAGSAGVEASTLVQNYLHSNSKASQPSNFDAIWNINAIYKLYEDANGNDVIQDNTVPNLSSPTFYGYDGIGNLVPINRPVFTSGDRAGYADDTVPTKMSFELADPAFAAEYEPRKYYGDVYGANGYSGVTHRNDQEFAGSFTLIGNFYPAGYHQSLGQ